MLRQLHHKNIVQFYGANLEPGSMFFVTELMKGGDLYSALRHHPDTMRWDRLGKKVAHDTALGINYLHTRCLSPSNIYQLSPLPIPILGHWPFVL